MKLTFVEKNMVLLSLTDYSPGQYSLANRCMA